MSEKQNARPTQIYDVLSCSLWFGMNFMLVLQEDDDARELAIKLVDRIINNEHTPKGIRDSIIESFKDED